MKRIIGFLGIVVFAIALSFSMKINTSSNTKLANLMTINYANAEPGGAWDKTKRTPCDPIWRTNTYSYWANLASLTSIISEIESNGQTVTGTQSYNGGFVITAEAYEEVEQEKKDCVQGWGFCFTKTPCGDV
ncbi:hypothetical protein [Flavivirga rizhaonensis]|uniref:Uncharacterized protein n=1 Tax=Flavivirga rizhaonensis TaxID=2559571 RepID=A0A4S1DZI7_9FLAO|nr:hypothetical protein [Flavivirga rizhaonensis]TGV03433.1 hypothetical protein EM932_07105 [Flavivirga rizhaonensis]